MPKIDAQAPAAPVYHDKEPRVTVQQVDFVVPGLTVKDLLSAIPYVPHSFFLRLYYNY